MNLLKQQSKEPRLEIRVPQHFVVPLRTPLRNLPRLLLAQRIPVPPFIRLLILPLPTNLINIRPIAAKPPDKIEMLIALQTHGDVMYPGSKPLSVPLAENAHFVRQAAALQEAVEAAGEGVAVHVQQVLVVPCILAVDALDHLEELLLRIAVAGVALPHVAEFDVDEVLQGSAVDVFYCELGVGLRLGADKDAHFVRCIEALDDVLAVLSSPAAVATEAAGRGATPVKAVGLVLPGRVMVRVVAHFAEPIPWAGVEDVLEAGDFGL
jgi:hypothetical protein